MWGIESFRHLTIQGATVFPGVAEYDDVVNVRKDEVPFEAVYDVFNASLEEFRRVFETKGDSQILPETIVLGSEYGESARGFFEIELMEPWVCIKKTEVLFVDKLSEYSVLAWDRIAVIFGGTVDGAEVYIKSRFSFLPDQLSGNRNTLERLLEMTLY